MNELSRELPSEFPVMEHFYTLQGEGFHAGRPAYFVRLGGCDVGCVWCDVKESWDATQHNLMSIQEIISEIKKSKTEFVVITGGEPAMYNLTNFVDQLHANNFEVAIETSGCYPLYGTIDWYCFSPKKFKKPVEEAYQKANELKVVIYHPSDLAWAEEHAQKVNKQCKLYIQPEWSKSDVILPLIIDFVKNNPTWRLSLQTHKYLNIP
jgi:organic radical activating enzyme